MKLSHLHRMFLSLILLAFASTAHAGQLSPGLERLIADMDPSDEIKVLVAMKNPPNVNMRSLDAELHERRAPLAERHVQVIETLRSAAQVSQAAILQDLELRRIQGSVRGFTPHWIVNGIVVVTKVSELAELASRPDVDVIEPNLEVELIEPVESHDKGNQARLGGLGLLPGIDAVEADRVWSELGIDGTGALVGNLDSGVDVNHPALSARWRGNFAPASECWQDGAGNGTATPSDTNSHGTHVMGTICGMVVGADSIGVAPGALWIADNSIDQGAGSELDNDVINALEWFADPDDNPATLDDVPDVVQNSWGVNENFSGYFDCDSRWWTAIDNCEAAGVVLTWSAGNEGSGSGTLRSPADRNTTVYNAFSVGSTIATPPFTISGFSSRGPSTCPGGGIKPEVSAPGSDIVSSVPGGGYGTKSGTSMAGPHVAGVVALMRAANPSLDVQTIKQVLMDTTTDLGVAGEDNTYGHGFINAYQAVLAVIDGYGTIEGTLTDASSSAPIAGATVNVLGDPRSTTTDASGFYRVIVPADTTYTLEFSAFGYITDTAMFAVVPDSVTNGDATLTAAPTARLSGVVRDFNLNLVDGATVRAIGTPLSPVTTAPDGSYEIFLPDLASYTVRASFPGLGPDTEVIAMSGDVVQDFELSELAYDDFETNDFSALPWTMEGNAPWTIDTSNPQEGTYSARSGSITHNQATSMVLDVTLRDPGDITFFYNVSSEANFDFLRFYIDGAQQDSWSGVVGWTQATYPVTAGQHTFRWEYTKDGSVNSNADAAWVDVVTLPPLIFPDIDVAPGSLSESLAPDQSSQQLLTISNVGAGPLSYSATLSGNIPLGAEARFEHVDLKKDELDPREGVSPTADSGGPDGFGYSWVDSNEPSGPTFDWFDISGIGTALSLTDDGTSGPHALGVTFPFYGTTYSEAYVSANGVISFAPISASTVTNDPIPDAMTPNLILAPYWDDLNPAAGGTVYVHKDALGLRWVCQWEGVFHFGTTDPQTFQVQLFEDGRIVYQYLDVSGAAESTVGIESGTGADGLEVVFNAAYLENNLAVTIQAIDPWTTVTPLSGTIPSLGQEVLTVDFNSTGLALGNYDANLTIASNDPDENGMVIPISLVVTNGATDTPVIGLPTAFALERAYPNPFASQSAIRFAVPVGGATADLSVFDVTGRRVATLVSGPQNAGHHVVIWDGMDSTGKRVAAGTYFYRLQAKEFEATQKVVRLR